MITLFIVISTSLLALGLFLLSNEVWRNVIFPPDDFYSKLEGSITEDNKQIDFPDSTTLKYPGLYRMVANLERVPVNAKDVSYEVCFEIKDNIRNCKEMVQRKITLAGIGKENYFTLLAFRVSENGIPIGANNISIRINSELPGLMDVYIRKLPDL